MLQALLIVGASFVMGMAMSPLLRPVEYEFNRLFPFRLPPEEVIIELYYREIITEEQYYELMAKHAYNKEQANNLFEIRKRLLTAEELIIAKWRRIITEEEYIKYMKKLGFTDDDIKRLEEVRKPIPSVSDIIRFAVRDVYSPEIVQKYGYDVFPEKFWETIRPDLEKTGMDEETLKKYWYAHWVLPSPTMGYEMLHRLSPNVMEVIGEKYTAMKLNPDEIITDLDTVDELLRASDYPDYWRKRLLAISYRPLTRVDLRRIYGLGLISDEELLARLMEIGYTEKDATQLLQFYKSLKIEKDRDLTRAMILEGFRDNIITRTEAKEFLIDLGYDEDEAEFILKLEEYDIIQKDVKDKAEVIVNQYARGAITKQELEQELTALNITQARKERYIIKAERARERTTRLPSKEDLRRWLKLRIIDEDYFRERMKQLKYKDEDIENYIREAK